VTLPCYKSVFFRWRLGALFALLVVSSLTIGCRASSTQPGPERGVSSPSGRGNAQATESVVRLTGTTEASHSFSVSAPQIQGAQLGSMVLTEVIPDGATVKAGDVLARFDPQTQTKDYLEKRDKYTELNGQLAQKRADEAVAKAKDDTAIQEADSASKNAELDEKKEEIVSKIDAEKNRETVQETKATLLQLRETYEYKRKAAVAEIRILELQRDLAAQAMRHAQANASKMIITSPMTGVAVRNSIWLGGRMGTVQAGDQVFPGVSFLQVVDPSQMQVRAGVLQPDVNLIRKGARVTVSLDAYPGLRLPATLEEISPVGQEGNFSNKIRIFNARFKIHGSDSRLLPDLSVALDVVVDGR
jgi:HlyD family secretion protein